jgi:FtsH-binding integral membrane protein
MDFLKSAGGKILSGVVALGVVVLAISWWRMDPGTHQMILAGAGRIVSWLLIVLFVPWATFFVIGRIARLDSNAAGATLVAGYTLVEILVLAWLFHWKMPNATAWTFLCVGALFAAVYNLFTCDWIAEKVS